MGQSLASAIVTPNSFVIPNEILNEISIVLSGMSSKMGQDQLLAVLPNVVSSNRSLPVLEAKQSLLIRSSVLGNWADQMETDSSSFLIKLVYVKAVFQLVHGFLGAKSVLKNNVKLFCVEFASQMSLKAAILVELTSSVCLAILKITKFLVVPESGFFSVAVVLYNVSLGVSVADIKTALSIFSVITCVVLKSAGIWQYVVVYFENLVAATSALNYWLVLVGKDSVQIFSLMNQQETIVSCDKFKAKLVNLSSGYTIFEISDMVSQIGEMDHLAVDYKVVLPLSFKTFKIFKSHFVSFLSYVKTSVPFVLSEFPPLVASTPLVAVENSLVFSWLASLESDLAKLFVLVEFIVKPVGSMVKVFEQFVNGNLVSSSALGLKVNEVLVHISTFSRAVGKLE
ncbi:hypothetical protein G9A89_020724 [Geosiphon pyriformis]|nr:hypothetical protein G9A89_020724 [Geosiphon pyriformis]